MVTIGGRVGGVLAVVALGLALPQVNRAQAERSADCGPNCEEFGRVRFEHPSWGPSELVVGATLDGPFGTCEFSVVDSTGASRWNARGTGCGVGASVYAPAPDAAGNMFVQYSTGRYPGVTVLRPTVDGMNDFASLPGEDGSDALSGRFWDSVAYDVDDDGDLEVISLIRPYEPDCASGNVYFQTFSWSGEEFFAELCTLMNWPTVPIQATPGAGGTVTSTIPSGTCGVRTNGAVDWQTDTGWYAVWFEDAAGWAPYDAFASAPGVPPWPEDYDPWSQDTFPPEPVVTSPPSCGSYRFNDQYPIRRCDEGYAVYMVQSFLSSLGYDVDVDGYFGPGTEVAVRSFQAANGLEVDGLVGPATWAALTGGSMPGYDTNGNGIIDPVEVVGD